MDVTVDLLRVFEALAKDVNLDPFTLSYCKHRLRKEGAKFLLVTLPKLAKAVLSSLEKGIFERPTDFAWKGRSLLHFRSFLNRIFDVRTGRVLRDVDTLALWQVRQLCEYFYKLAVPFTERQLHQAEFSFVKTEFELRLQDYDSRWVDQLRKDFETYYPELSRATAQEILAAEPPKPGPGTFSGKRDFERATKLPWYARKDLEYDVPDCFNAHRGLFRATPNAPVRRIDDIDPDYSEVLFVPKDSRGPRTIVREPYHRLRCQMSFNAFMSGALERLSQARINFKNQQVNRSLALASSQTREFATLDLKDASDRVDQLIVRQIFSGSPGLSWFVRTRTKRALLPSGRFHRLRKLSGMGSGLTFPTMSLLIHLTITREIVNRTSLSYAEARLLTYVYGDDIVVPVPYVSYALEALRKVKLLVNVDKSYIHSHFRESCGGDYYLGQDVSPVRLKLSSCQLSLAGHMLQVSSSLSVLSIERHCRELRKNGLIDTAEYLYNVLESVVGKLPYVSGLSPVIGRWKSFVDYPTESTGMYQSIRVLLPLPKQEKITKNPWLVLRAFFLRSGYPQNLLDRLLVPSDGQTSDEVSVPRSVRYRRTRVSAFRLMG